MEGNKRSRWDSDSDEDNDAKARKKAAKKEKKAAEASKAKSEPSLAHPTDVQSSKPEAIVSNTDKKVESNVIASESTNSSSSSRNISGTGGGRRTVPDIQSCRSVDNYERLNFIDQGTYGMVFRGRCIETNEIYALKQIKLNNQEVNKFGFPITAFREINILLALNHPNIIRVREIVVGSTMDKIFMVMDYYENDLKSAINLHRQSFSTAEIKQLLLQLLSAVAYMHEKGYLHRDLKTSNLLYGNLTGRLCICDFGLARKYESDPVKPYTQEVVTLWYRAPELLLGGQYYSTPLDIWSVGCIFAELLTQKPLFPGQGEADQIQKIFKVLGLPNEEKWPGYQSLPHINQLSVKYLSNVNKLRDILPAVSFKGNSIPLSELGLDLATKLLAMDPKQRISAKVAMQHAWLTAEAPYPTPEHLMPTFASRHEQQQQRQQLQKQQQQQEKEKEQQHQQQQRRSYDT